MHSRRNGHERLHARVLEDRKEHDEPEGEREMPDSLQAERSTFLANMTFTTGLVCHVINPTEVAVEEEHGHGTEE